MCLYSLKELPGVHIINCPLESIQLPTVVWGLGSKRLVNFTYLVALGYQHASTSSYPLPCKRRPLTSKRNDDMTKKEAKVTV
jgi:hypothetical protein